MKTQRFVVGIMIVNVVILIAVWLRANSASTPGIAPVLRGQALEIVDAQGRVRASIKVQTAEPGAKSANGKPYGDTVILRLVDQNGRPEVKLGGSERGAGLGLLGESDSTAVVIKAEGGDSSIKLTTRDGREQVIKP